MAVGEALNKDLTTGMVVKVNDEKLFEMCGSQVTWVGRLVVTMIQMVMMLVMREIENQI
jgi:hypothetical protein